MAELPYAAVACAFLGAALFAVSAVAQHQAASEVPQGQALMARLVRSPRWWAGIIGDTGGFAFQVAALALGSVLVVQPILVSALVFALPLAGRYSRRPVTWAMWLHALALSVALAVFLVVGDPTPGNPTAPWHDWLIPTVILALAVGAAVAGATTLRRPTPRALLLGTAAGLLFGFSAALTEQVTHLFGVGILAVLTSWNTYALIAGGLLGLYLQQLGYQAGPLAASLPAFTVTEPLGAAFMGMTVLDERLRSGPLATAVVLASVIVMGVAAVRLAQAESADQVADVTR